MIGIAVDQFLSGASVAISVCLSTNRMRGGHITISTSTFLPVPLMTNFPHKPDVSARSSHVRRVRSLRKSMVQPIFQFGNLINILHRDISLALWHYRLLK